MSPPSTSTDDTPVRHASALIAAGLLSGALLSLTVQTAAAAVPRRFGLAAAVVGVILFVVGAVLCVVAIGLGALRAGEGQEVDVMGLFLLQGSVPAPVRRLFLGVLLVVTVVAVATAWRAPFGLLGAVFPLGAAGLWSALYGDFPQSK